MIGMLSRKKGSAQELLRSSLHDERSFYRAFSKDLKRARQEVIIESPFVTIRRTKEILPLLLRAERRGSRVIVYTRNPNHHDGELRFQSWRGVYVLRDAGIKVKICNDMRHRKLAMIDKTILWEGSLNMLSQNNSREIMRRTKSPELCQQMLKFCHLNRWWW